MNIFRLAVFAALVSVGFAMVLQLVAERMTNHGLVMALRGLGVAIPIAAFIGVWRVSTRANLGRKRATAKARTEVQK